MNKVFVFNSSPIIALTNANLEAVIELAINGFLIPELVAKEVSNKANGDNAIRFIEKHKSKQRQNINLKKEVVEWGLGDGETSVISLCMESPNFIGVLDDKKARKCASTFGVSFTGTLGLLINANKQGKIDSLEESLQKILGQGLFISKDLINKLQNNFLI